MNGTAVWMRPLSVPSFTGSPTKGTKSEVATSTLPPRGPKRGRKCYVTPAFSGVPNKGDKIRSSYLTPAFSGLTSKIWHILNAQAALKTQSWNNKLVEKGKNQDLSICRHTTLCTAGALRAHCGQGIPKSVRCTSGGVPLTESEAGVRVPPVLGPRSRLRRLCGESQHDQTGQDLGVTSPARAVPLVGAIGTLGRWRWRGSDDRPHLLLLLHVYCASHCGALQSRGGGGALCMILGGQCFCTIAMSKPVCYSGQQGSILMA